MNVQQTKFVRFKECKSESSWSPERQHAFAYGGLRRTKLRRMLDATVDGFWRGFENCFDKIKSLRISTRPSLLSGKTAKAKSDSHNKKILDPQGGFVQVWNKIVLISCVIALALDPLFFYIPVYDRKNKCLDLDDTMKIIACVFRSVTDLFYVFHIILQFRTGFIAPSSRVFGRGELVGDPLAIARRYLSSYFLVDILAVLPVPQVEVLLITPSVNRPIALITKQSLKFTIYAQYVPRIIRIYPLYKEVNRTSGILTETVWAGAAFNLLLYMLASHVIGAFWYLFAIERKDTYWHKESKINACNSTFLYCDPKGASLNHSCPLIEPDEITNSTTSNFGMFKDALDSRVVESRDFPKKLFYCFWWGLRNLSSYGQGLTTSNSIKENVFAIVIAIFGLVLFALLIGNMQKYLQSATVRVEEMRVRRRDAERWMSHRMLPDSLRQRIRRYEQYKWQVKRGVEEEFLISSLPKDLRRDIKRHLCLDLLMRVPMFEKMDEQLLDAMCDRLKPVLYTEKSLILREGDPVDEMLFIIRGMSITMTTNGGRTGFFNSVYLRAGDFCGEELLTWALDPNSSSNLPTSTRTVETITEVEAFLLTAEDLKFVASQFRRLHSKQLRHAFRFYSQQWRTWAACFIQAAWRRLCRRKQEAGLHEAEGRLQDALANESGTSTSFAATFYASRFAANALRALRSRSGTKNRIQPRLPPLVPQKPIEPDFGAANDH